MGKKVREGYKKTDFGEIPIEWKVKKFRDIFERIVEKNKNNISDNVLTISAQNGLINQEKFFNKSVASKNTSNYFLLKKGDFAYNKSYSSGYPMGAIKRLNSYNKGIVSPLYICFRIKDENINSDFYEQFFEYDLFDKAISGIAQEGARNHGLLNVAVNEFFDLPIIVPTKEEQKKIAEILSTVDKQIENTEKLIQKNQELKKGLMQQLLTKGIGHTEFNKTEFGDIPKEWSVISSNKVFNVITDYVANGSFADLAKNVEYKEYEEYAILVRLTDYKNNYKGPFIYVDKNAYDFLGKSKLEENDIIISNVGAYAGYVFRAPSIKKPITLGPNAILVRSNENRDFLYYWLSSDIGQKKIREIISTTAQPKFNKTDFKKIKLPIPSLDEQEKIALILSSIDKKIEQDKYKKEKLEEVKKGLMQNLLTGKLRVI
ncbi:restriction endonuclease subunit S [Clostridium perfringens]|uniref:restriction endonuclease subunit S n=1 Tax=Clostridium perfringens TaxID=1502 RepID=UPI0018E48BD1|nr:restriction endonuclease subunit S [Clostridium perfringens]MBI6084002.1 restriction endonuclease subunit S [Clostridium perfringens]MBI6100386.1 restriction endonuclease subunit S [Clostridium perfringens]